MIDMNDSQNLKIKCLEIRQPIGEFYIGVMRSEDLVKIAFADIRRLETGSEKREIEVYSGIQRELSVKRVKDIGKYVNLSDATFPSSVILHIKKEDVEFISRTGELHIPFRDNIAKVLDGQHRIAGLENHDGANGKFEVPVTFFIEMELEDQAIVFATINKSHTKVNKSLVADLFAFARTRSPQKTSHTVIRALDQKNGSPFFGKIKILGSAVDKEKETITQATFSKSLIDLMSKDPMIDRDIYRKGNVPRKFSDGELQRRPLRNLFIDQEDVLIAKIIWEYFSAVEEKWRDAWHPVKKDNILNKSTGFIALMRFFRLAYNSSNQIGSVVEKSFYLAIFDKTSLKSEDFTKENFIPGGSGLSKLLSQLKEESGIN